MGISTIRQRLPVAIMPTMSLVLVLSMAVFFPIGAVAQETVTVPFANGPNGVTTTNNYSGSVSINVSGFGQAAESKYSDAFYIFTNNSGNQITPEHHSDFGLCINNQPVDSYLATIPSFRSDHTYQFTISIGSSPHEITFGVCDTFTSDNSGSFTIIVPAPSGKVYTGGKPKGRASNLIVLVHGCCTNNKDVKKDWGWGKESLATLIKETIIQRHTPVDWEIVVWDWSKYTPKAGAFWVLANAISAYGNAENQGHDLATTILNLKRKYNYIHMVSHSAGAKLIDVAATDLVDIYKNQQAMPFIHLTFLDAFRPLFDDYGNLDNYPSQKHYAEHYVDVNHVALFTNDTVPSAYNFDITNWEDKKVDKLGEFGHQWPRRWYTRSVEFPDKTGVLGFDLSREGGNEEFCVLSEQFPPGNSCQLTNLASEVLCINFVPPITCQ